MPITLAMLIMVAEYDIVKSFQELSDAMAQKDIEQRLAKKVQKELNQVCEQPSALYRTDPALGSRCN